MSTPTIEKPAIETASTAFSIHRNDWFSVLDDVLPFTVDQSEALMFPMLGTVQVRVSESGLITAAATDRFTIGRRLYQLDKHEGSAVEILLPLQAIKDMRRIHVSTPRGSLENKITLSITSKGDDTDVSPGGKSGTGGSITVDSRGGTVSSTHEGFDAKFVDVSVFLKDDTKFGPVDRIAWSPVLMARFAKVKGANAQNTLVRFESPSRPIRVDIGDTFSGAIMPGRLK